MTFYAHKHCLPIEQRVKYKILLLMFKCHIKEAPLYLMDVNKHY